MMKLAQHHAGDTMTIKIKPVLRYLVEMAHLAYAQGRQEHNTTRNPVDRASETDMIATLESWLVDAGETCPADYQNGFDWPRYNAMIARVKRMFESIFRARDREVETCSALEKQRDEAIAESRVLRETLDTAQRNLSHARATVVTAQAGTRSMREWFERAKKQLEAAVLGGEIDTREVDEILKV